MRDRLHFNFLNVGHFIDHMATLVYATVAALALTREWNMTYAELATYATPGFIAFGLFAVPAGWLADRWSREGMMAVFFIGIGAASIATAFANSPVQIAIGLFAIGVFAAIYHPVGLAIVVGKYAKAGMALAVNGVWGNLGMACAALVTGVLIDQAGWRTAFVLPGLFSIAVGIAYTRLFWPEINVPMRAKAAGDGKGWSGGLTGAEKMALIRAAALVYLIVMMSSFVFQSMSFALPKIFEERLAGIGSSATTIGAMAFAVFAVASLSQLIAGKLLDRVGPRTVLLGLAGIECLFFALMPGLTDWLALFVALMFMMAAFGQVPVMDLIIGKLARSEVRSLAYGLRYIVSFGVAASTVPLMAYIHAEWGFDVLFWILAVVASAIFLGVSGLPTNVPGAGPTPVPTPAAARP